MPMTLLLLLNLFSLTDLLAMLFWVWVGCEACCHSAVVVVAGGESVVAAVALLAD